MKEVLKQIVEQEYDVTNIHPSKWEYNAYTRWKKEKLDYIEKGDFSDVADIFADYCENWPQIPELFYDPDGKKVYPEDREEGVEYTLEYEDADVENWESSTKIDENGIQYIDVTQCGGDWQPCSTFKIYVNKEGSEKPLICIDVETDPFDEEEY